MQEPLAVAVVQPMTATMPKVVLVAVEPSALFGVKDVFSLLATQGIKLRLYHQR
jgi:hypothetical protein